MFTTEIASVHKLDDLTYDLSAAAGDLNDQARDLETFFDDFIGDEDMLEPSNADWMFRDAVASEREAQSELVRFDRILNRVIAERIKLGGFTLTVEM